MTVRLIIVSAKYLIAKINSMLIPGNAKRIMYWVIAKQRLPTVIQRNKIRRHFLPN